MSVTKERAERLLEERVRTEEKRQDIVALAEKDDGRELSDTDKELVDGYRSRVEEIDKELDELAGDLERENKSQRISALIRVRETAPDDDDDGNGGEGDAGEGKYRTFAQYARDKLIVRFDQLANAAGDGNPAHVQAMKQRAQERLERTIEHTLTSDIPGLLPPQHMAEIMDLINNDRPVVSTSRRVDLSRGTMTYPKITQRPTVELQGTEKTEGGTQNMTVDLASITADTYIGAGNLSWQSINWSTPDALQLWFSLAAESYAIQTETAACTAIQTGPGTASPALGTAGTESLADWRSAVLSATGTLYTNTSGRARTNTLYLSADQFFYLAALANDQSVQMSPVGSLDVGNLTGTFSGLRVVGSYGFTARTRIVGDSNAFLVGETPGSPVELRAVEPSIGGMEVGVIGAFAAKLFDSARFLKLNVNA